MIPERGRRLGRGLEALLGKAASGEHAVDQQSALQQINIARIQPNPFQPRRDFSEAELAELESSIARSGMLQPVIVRPTATGFELISGERRFRAALRLGWAEVPAIVREADDQTALTLALIENLQRANLSVVEQAKGFRQLQEEFSLTQQEIAEAVGKDRSTVANLLRLLSLPAPALELLERGDLSMGHARALLGLSDADAIASLAAEVAARQLSVREVELRIRDHRDSGAASSRKTAGNARSVTGSTPAKSAAVLGIEDRLRRHFQTDVRIDLSAADRGTIQISFYSADDLERLLEILQQSEANAS